jgi:YD repeat-containing protein
MIFFVVFSILFSQGSFADVSLKNGNFFVGFTHIQYPGDLEPKVLSTYNSKLDYVSPMFGYGWGSEYETRLMVDPDGSVLIVEHGGGAENRFVPKSYSAALANKKMNEMVSLAVSKGLAPSGRALDDFKSRVQSDPKYRSNLWSTLVRRGFAKAVVLKNGTQLVSSLYRHQYVTKVKGGFVRVNEYGEVYRFDAKGRLTQLQNRSGHFIRFSYGKNGKIAGLIDNQKRRMKFVYKTFGAVGDRLVQVLGISGLKASFNYDPSGMLIFSRDMKGIENTFKYGPAPYFNLVEIGFPATKQSLKVEYYGADKFLNVKSVRNPDGSQYDYSYGKSSDPMRYSVSIAKKDSSKRVVSRSKYEYKNKRRASGEPFTIQLKSNINGSVTVTDYDEKTGLPKKVDEGGSATEYQYDSRGRTILKKTSDEIVAMKYDPKSGKLSRVEKTELPEKKKSWSAFTWDPKAHVVLSAKNSAGQWVKLVWDRKSRPLKISNEKGMVLTLRYNENDRPSLISSRGKGKLMFTYKASGEVDQMTSDGGDAVTDEIIGVIQTVYDLVRPSGANLGI